MRPDIHALKHFYASAAGKRMQAVVQDALDAALSGPATDRILGLGYANPYLGDIYSKAERVIVAHPQLQGGAPWPQNAPSCCVQVDEYGLPFAEAIFDKVLVVHALEFSDPARRLLREIWRVLAPRGRLILVVPNRMSLLTLFDSSPFGNGRPYSALQLKSLLRDAMFDLHALRGVAVLPGGGGGTRMDKVALKLLPRVAGLHVVVAQKSDSIAFTGIERRRTALRAQNI
jgi:SAM-dependent methyltransferase